MNRSDRTLVAVSLADLLFYGWLIRLYRRRRK